MKDKKFRGINKNRNWSYGFLSIGMDSFLITERHDVPPSMLDPCGDVVVTYDRVAPETIGQYIDKEDKNKKEVYQGDILRSHIDPDIPLHHVVEWSDKYMGWFMHNVDDVNRTGDGSVQAWVYFKNCIDFEVVGNIHQNPGLLKTGDQP